MLSGSCPRSKLNRMKKGYIEPVKKLHPLLIKEDYWAIWLGIFFLCIGLLAFFEYEKVNTKRIELKDKMEVEANLPFKTLAWHQASMSLKSLKGGNNALAKNLKYLLVKPNQWEGNPLRAFYDDPEIPKTFLLAENEVKNLYEEAYIATEKAKNANYVDPQLNQQAEENVEKWKAANDRLAIEKRKFTGTYNHIVPLLLVCTFLALIFGIGAHFMGIGFIQFVRSFAFVFLIAVLAYTIGEHSTMVYWGFGYAAWAIILGLLISNTIGTPTWLKVAALPEYFIKTGLVLLGSEILLSKILAIGLPGIFVAWVVTPIVLISTYWFGQKVLRINSKTLNITISADMSVCGVSAAIATAAACNAKKEELTLAVGLSMIFTAVMMIVLPAVIKLLGLPEVLGGAWIGGTIDATGAVVAAGAFLGDTALNVAATIKMIQNVLIGFVAFGVAVYWSVKVDKKAGVKVGWNEIWLRFPKFILGFLGASILFSVIHASIGDTMGNALLDQGVARGFVKNLREWLFCLAFVSIGLSTNFRELKGYIKDGKALTLYVCGQSFNLLLTLLMAWIMFYLVFPHITNSL